MCRLLLLIQDTENRRAYVVAQQSLAAESCRASSSGFSFVGFPSLFQPRSSYYSVGWSSRLGTFPAAHPSAGTRTEFSGDRRSDRHHLLQRSRRAQRPGTGGRRRLIDRGRRTRRVIIAGMIGPVAPIVCRTHQYNGYADGERPSAHRIAATSGHEGILYSQVGWGSHGHTMPRMTGEVKASTAAGLEDGRRTLMIKPQHAFICD